jgi:hypothetical protein
MTGRPTGWLDEERKDASPTPAEVAFLELALKAYRAANAEGRRVLRGQLRALLSAQL